MNIDGNDLIMHPKILKLKKMDLSAFNVLSYYNMVIFFRKELLSMMNRKVKNKTFSNAQQISLIKTGLIFIYTSRRNDRYSGTITYPTCLTRMILNGIVTIKREELIDMLEYEGVKNA